LQEELTLDSIDGLKIYQHRKGYRFSVDSVVLARFVELPKRIKSVADIGAGTGVIGLLVAKRFSWIVVDLFEIQQSLCELAKMNAELNNLATRANIICTDIRKIGSEFHERYDAIVTNPPFRPGSSGRVSPYDERALARHEITLTLPELLKVASLMLKNRGYFYIIYIAERMAELLCLMHQNHLQPKRLRPVYHTKDKDASMILVEAVKNAGPSIKIESPLYIEEEGL